jgi:hypothetical protein
VSGSPRGNDFTGRSASGAQGNGEEVGRWDWISIPGWAPSFGGLTPQPQRLTKDEQAGDPANPVDVDLRLTR